MSSHIFEPRWEGDLTPWSKSSELILFTSNKAVKPMPSLPNLLFLLPLSLTCPEVLWATSEFYLLNLGFMLLLFSQRLFCKLAFLLMGTKSIFFNLWSHSPSDHICDHIHLRSSFFTSNNPNTEQKIITPSACSILFFLCPFPPNIPENVRAALLRQQPSSGFNPMDAVEHTAACLELISTAFCSADSHFMIPLCSILQTPVRARGFVK